MRSTVPSAAKRPEKHPAPRSAARAASPARPASAKTRGVSPSRPKKSSSPARVPKPKPSAGSVGKRPASSPPHCPKACKSTKSIGTLKPLNWTPDPPTKEIESPTIASSVAAAFFHATQHLITQSRMVIKPAIVLDIDDTALIGADDKQRTHGPVWEFYQKAIELKVAVFFVTARSESYAGNRKSTEDQLKQCGYSVYERLLMADRYTTQFGGIKKKHRQTIADEHYRILVNAGDQWADLVSRSVKETTLVTLEEMCKGRPLVFYNLNEQNCLCIKLWR